MTANAPSERDPGTQVHAPDRADSSASRETAFSPSFAAHFIRTHILRIAIISTAVLVPCFWHREIEAADLGSHLYNAWLVQLIRHGYAPGLWLAHPRTNVLFDYLLSGFGALFGFHVGERITVSIAALIFFWGMFAFAAAAARRAPWFLAPAIAIFAYGFTFHMGFVNYYLSLGLSFFGVAIFWRGSGRARWLALAPVPFILLAHPLGLVWLAAACAWIALAEKLRPRYHVLLMLAAAALLVAMHFWFWTHYVVQPRQHPTFFYTGADQMLLFGASYRIVEWAFIAFAACALAADLVRRLRERVSARSYLVPFELYVATGIALLALPGLVYFPQQVAPLSFIAERLTSVSAALICCLLAAMRPRIWHLAASAAVAAFFFACLYRDTGAINRIEAQADALVQSVPPGSRVMGRIPTPRGSRIPIQHILDRACIGHCFSYGNYEPGSRMFRVRAAPGNPFVLADYGLALATERGDYIVQPEDLPAWDLCQCDLRGKRLCIAPLAAGQPNDLVGIHSPSVKGP